MIFFVVQGADGKIIPLSAATLQKLIDSGAIKPGTQVNNFYLFQQEDSGAIKPGTQVVVFICANTTRGQSNPAPR